MSSSSSYRRTMAGAGRNYYIKDGSNPTGITDEIRDLVKNQGLNSIDMTP